MSMVICLQRLSFHLFECNLHSLKNIKSFVKWKTCSLFLLSCHSSLTKNRVPPTDLVNILSSRYSFAIVGINITDLAYSLLVSGALKTHLYNVAPEMPSLLHFQQTFCEYIGLGWTVFYRYFSRILIYVFFILLRILNVFASELKKVFF